MKILVLGGRGMAGHMIVDYFHKRTEHDIFYTSRDRDDKEGFFLDVRDPDKTEQLIKQVSPDILINCIGLLNENASKNKVDAFYVNGILPHQLASWMERKNGKLIHISTDCVFSGERGSYTENDQPDPVSVYGKTKALGEIKESDVHLTIRTSMIGPELKENGIGLFQWFMKQRGEIFGYKQVFWNGVTTLELAKAINQMINNNITGLYHLCSESKISKHDLLKWIKQVFQKDDVRILEDESHQLDRTLLQTRSDFHYAVPDYEQMLIELKNWMDQS
ncbi:dTDP-4-dehydrorhamnose reductase [Melghiribacillus thermohalophilus]|uniref:dTDP-4-dehydrorhamnose reductase n=1 Tax=Melghiribacillus thermohalophilus TaxID=1324956 RepID=A0A4R3NCZ7_9BACI|nr:SDR family oxidoreductase [Melghiribacillus thermohalophilus]TCT25019.1 dTDP-4-dehydrorhamnose reductase [Melghiribacillus thermohalophilus]